MEIIFKPHPTSKQMRFDSEYEAILPSGSRITRKVGHTKTIHQLWLNSEEYNILRKKVSTFHIHFYGQNYVYLNEYADLTNTLELLLGESITYKYKYD